MSNDMPDKIWAKENPRLNNQPEHHFCGTFFSGGDFRYEGEQYTLTKVAEEEKRELLDALEDAADFLFDGLPDNPQFKPLCDKVIALKLKNQIKKED